MMLERRRVTDLVEVRALEPAWDELLQTSATGSPFCAFAWCVSWWETFGRGWRPEVYVWEERGRVVGLLPLMRRTRFGLFREVRFLNGPQVAPEQLDALTAAPARQELTAEVTRLIHDLGGECDRLTLDDLAPDGLLADAVRAVAAADEVETAIRSSPPQAGVRVVGTFDDYFAARGQRARRNFRHSLREFAKRWNAAPAVERPASAAAAAACFSRLWALHGESFARRGEHDYFGRLPIERFHRAVLRHSGILPFTRFVTVASEDRVFAAVYCLAHRGRTYCYQLGFDPSVEKYSPGFVAIGRAIQGAFEEGGTYFDFLRGNEKYKQRWADATHTTVTFTLTMNTVGGGLWQAMEGVLGGLRRVKRAVGRRRQRAGRDTAPGSDVSLDASQDATAPLPSGE